MSLQDKIASAKPTTFLTDGLSKEEVKQAVDEGRRRMSDLISRQKVLNTLDFADNALTDEERTVEMYKELLTKCIKVLPSAENKGEWLDDGFCGDCKCSVCKHEFDCDIANMRGFDFALPNFCPNCGADMRGE